MVSCRESRKRVTIDTWHTPYTCDVVGYCRVVFVLHCTVNALSKSLYEGTGDFYYTRRGHIPGSQLLYFDAVLDNEYFLPASELAEKLEAQHMLSAEEVITYCGGGIAATLDAFACKLMGQDNVAVYDGSMSEWVQDESRPLSLGSAP